jgi:signal transduction histidine kinase
LDSTPHIAVSPDPARLKRGAGVLIAVFWVVHLAFMLLRAELRDLSSERDFQAQLESLQRRGGFALFGSLVSYILYRFLRLLRQRPFERQAMIGAALALAAAGIQAVANVVVFRDMEHSFIANVLYAILYWFWFYFSWTAAYLALSYSITVQEQERHAAKLAVDAQEAQVRALRYQINPHFLFNTLNAIAALIRDAPTKGEQMVENAVKHGVARSEGPTCIAIRAQIDGPMLEIVVENDARSSGSDARGEKVGLGNVRDRLRSRFGDAATLSTDELAQGGFRNTLRIPLRR